MCLGDPQGMNRERRRWMLGELADLNRQNLARVRDPEIEARIAQAEMAYRMQTSVPDLMDLSNEPKHVLRSYGDDVRTTGSFARHCLLARRMAERGVRFIQLYHRDWDHHGSLPKRLPALVKDTDQPSAALIRDLKERGLLDDTLVIWGGEFGRTPYAQGNVKLGDYGGDHHGKTFSSGWPAEGSNPGSLTVPRTILVLTCPRTPSTSTTCSPCSCTASGSTTHNSPTVFRCASTDSRTFAGAWAKASQPNSTVFIKELACR